MLAKAIDGDGQADRVAVEEPPEIGIGGEPLARMTLCGFARRGGVSVDTGPERVGR